MIAPSIPPECPFCHSEYIVIGPYSYFSDGTRSVNLRCKDCNRTFNYESYSSESVKQKSAEMMLEDLVSWGLVSEGIDGNYTISQTGLLAIKDASQEAMDDIILKHPVWKSLFEIMPLHPSYERFVRDLRAVSKNDNYICDYECRRVWHKYQTEALPARERQKNRDQRAHGINGLQGITILPYEHNDGD